MVSTCRSGAGGGLAGRVGGLVVDGGNDDLGASGDGRRRGRGRAPGAGEGERRAPALAVAQRRLGAAGGGSDAVLAGEDPTGGEGAALPGSRVEQTQAH
jgi:hypothetical protein